MLAGMSAPDRRTFLRGAVALIASATIPHPNATGESPLSSYGCCIPAKEFGERMTSSEGTGAYFSGNEPIVPKSGDDIFDRALAHMLANISKTFDVVPGFGYYDDRDAANACARPEPLLNRTDGTVLFGKGLLQTLRSEKYGELHVAAVCAHEFGHILQFRYGVQERLSRWPTVKRIELHADFLAGYFAAKHKHDKPDFPAVEFAVAQAAAGDNYFFDVGHHGTSEERGAAVVAGFNSYRDLRLSLTYAVAAGEEYVRSI
jgi:hypothetical protein